MNLNICKTLQESAGKLLFTDKDAKTIGFNEFYTSNQKVQDLCEELFPVVGEKSAEEEAGVLVSLFMGYNAIIYNPSDIEGKKQVLLDRACAVLKNLDDSVLKCNLLLWSYAETAEMGLREEAKEIIVSWGGRELSDDEIGAMEFYNSLVGVIS